MPRTAREWYFLLRYALFVLLTVIWRLSHGADQESSDQWTTPGEDQW